PGRPGHRAGRARRAGHHPAGRRGHVPVRLGGPGAGPPAPPGGHRRTRLPRRHAGASPPAPFARPAPRRATPAALTAPAPHHSEPWRFVVLETAAARAALLDAMREAWTADLRGDGFTPEQIARRLRRGDVLRNAPLIIVPCLVTDAAHDYPD